jgi:radical SAM superfamily enzyme YgiQ (UPF0313 family)
MRVLFVFPRWEKLLESRPELKEEISGYEIGSFKMVSLGIPTAAACLPEGVEAILQDQNLGEIDYEVEADLVAIGFFTPQASQAYRIADRFRELGKPTLAGGIHPSNAPDDTLKHFDAVVVGEVEGLWERILDDLRGDRLGGVYRREAPPADLFLEQPMRSLFGASNYLKTDVVQVARGCYFRCPFCIVPGTYGRELRFRPVTEVVEEIRNLPHKTYYIAEENILFEDGPDARYCEELARALAAAGTGKVFYVANYPEKLRNFPAERMRLLYEAGCRQIYLVLGMDGPLHKELRDPAHVAKIWEFEDHGIEIMASITLGHDEDDLSCRDLVLDFCKEARLNLVEFTISVPFPGTPFFARLKSEGRILHEDWGKYNAANVVFRPKRMSEQELLDLYLELWRAFYRDIPPFEMYKRYVKAFTGAILVPGGKPGRSGDGGS